MFKSNWIVALAVWLTIAAAPMRKARGQCEYEWLPGVGYSGLNDYVTASGEWDPDGEGPQPAKIVLAGRFTYGNGSMRGLALLDPVTRALSTFPGDPTLSLPAGVYMNLVVQTPDGKLLLGGSERFYVNGVDHGSLVQWDGNSWASYREKLLGSVHTVAFLPGDVVLVGGQLIRPAAATSTTVACLWRHGGAGWSLIPGMSLGSSEVVRTMRVDAGGKVYVGGTFAVRIGIAPDHQHCYGLATWDGASWTSIGTTAIPLPGVLGDVHALELGNDGSLTIAGDFGTVSGLHHRNLARWNGTVWTGFIQNLSPDVYRKILKTTAGEWVVATAFGRVQLATGPQLADIYVPTVGVFLNCLYELPGGHLLYAGDFSASQEPAVHNIGVLSNGVIAPLSPGTDGQVVSLVRTANGEVVAHGTFDRVHGMIAQHAAVYSNDYWSEHASRTFRNIHVSGFDVLREEVLIAGNFAIESPQGSKLARLRNGELEFVTGGPPGTTHRVVSSPDGAIFLGGSYTGSGLGFSGVCRLNDSTWLPVLSVGQPSPVGVVRDLIARSASDLWALYSSPGIVRHYNGTVWTSLGSSVGISLPATMLRLPDESILVGGTHPTIRRWDGSNWSDWVPLVNTNGSPRVSILKELGDGRIVVGGRFTTIAEVPARNIAVWDGSTWSSIGSGVDGEVKHIELANDGTVVVAGDIGSAGDVVSYQLARFRETCPCPADLDNGSLTGVRDDAVTIEDMLFFLTMFEAGHISADLDNDGDPQRGLRDQAVTVEDLLFFLARFEAGC